MSTKHLTDLKKKPNDEWYTTRRNIQTAMELTITDQLKDKIIYLPADSDESEIYKYLVETKDKYQYKELIHTSDDFRTHEDLFEYCDIVLTNPPFSLKTKMFEIIDKYDKDYFIYSNKTDWCNLKILKKHFNEGKVKKICSRYFDRFTRPDGNIERARCDIYSTLFNKNLCFDENNKVKQYKLKKSYKDLKKHEFDQNGYLNIDYAADLPFDYQGVITCTVSLLPFYEDCGLIEILRPVESYSPVVNGKRKFIRMPIRIKNPQ